METNPTGAGESHLVFPSTGTSRLVSACTQPAQALTLHNHIPLMRGFARICLHDPLFPAKGMKENSAENVKRPCVLSPAFCNFSCELSKQNEFRNISAAPEMY